MEMQTRFDRILANSTSTTTRTKEGRRQIAQAQVDALTLDEAMRAHTAFDSFDALIADSLRTGYRPSLYTTPRGSSVLSFHRAALAKRIADAYDAKMTALGKPARAFRGN